MNDKRAAARVLDEIARLLELSEPNPFKARAFERAARALESSGEDLDRLVREDRLLSVAGIGRGIGPVVAEIVTTGRSAYLEELRLQYPPGIFEMMRVPGLGLKKIGILYSTLGVASLADLEEAARAGHVAGLKGFGGRAQAAILEGIDKARDRRSLFLLPVGLEVAEAVRGQLAAVPGIADAEITGSVRRRMEMVRNVNIAVAAADAGAAMTLVRKRALLDQIVTADASTLRGLSRDGMEVQLHFADPRDFGTAVLRTTGSEAFVDAIIERLGRNGYEIRERRLHHNGRHVSARSERALFEKAGIPFVEPELRENGDELKRKKRVKLVEPADLRGTFHIHTTFSDGRNSVPEMLAAARDRGFEYAGLSDHSKAAFYARGLTEDDLVRQHAAIAANGAAVAPMRVFRGTEADILNDGAIDYGHATLQRFDFVVASVHSRFGMSHDEMTERLLRALDDPFVTFLGHLTGRLLLSRDGYGFDFDRVFDRAAERGVIVEINGNPRRLELDWRRIRQAVDRGVVLSIHPDAHSTNEMAYVVSGTWVARKGGLSARQIFNARPLDEVAEYLKARRGRAIGLTQENP